MLVKSLSVERSRQLVVGDRNASVWDYDASKEEHGAQGEIDGEVRGNDMWPFSGGKKGSGERSRAVGYPAV